MAIALQDFKSRAVYWFWFPLLMVLFVTDLKLAYRQSFIQTGEITLMNAGFLIMQLLLVSVYFSVKNKRLINITNELLGWGDILLLLSLTCYFSTLNYIFFYVCSLIAVVLVLIARALIKRPYELIPLAGLQACILLMCLVISWYYKISLANGEWIQQLIY